MKILIATANAHKVGEIREILADFPIELCDLRDFPPVAAPDETGLTYAENALLKARFYAAHTGLPALSDDSGLEVDALDGAPGLYSARFGGEDMPHSQKILRVLDLLQQQPERPRSARFRCCCVLLDPNTGQVWTEEATCEGTIASAPSGEQGFGYDPIFLVDPVRSMADLSASEKHAISHRGQALRGLLGQLYPHLSTARA
ncbi:MAG: RdgB/HAM1 family non-canonical purine NTP pyrophosphatase [Candidatus Eremiobacteraeota bacterium]|nr:RdgB/HAM1 family non-canonical purine NTP pyrophosphatase [Candidatus Eremiobacteraeota bacterium]